MAQGHGRQRPDVAAGLQGPGGIAARRPASIERRLGRRETNCRCRRAGPPPKGEVCVPRQGSRQAASPALHPAGTLRGRRRTAGRGGLPTGSSQTRRPPRHRVAADLARRGRLPPDRVRRRIDAEGLGDDRPGMTRAEAGRRTPAAGTRGTRSTSSYSLASAVGFRASRYQDQARAFAVVSWPASRRVSASSRTWPPVIAAPPSSSRASRSIASRSSRRVFAARRPAIMRRTVRSSRRPARQILR